MTAIELARAGQAVTIVEANHVGAGATGSSMGVLSTPAAGAGFGDPDEIVHGRARKAWHRDRLAAQQFLLRLMEESGSDCDLQQGAVLLAPTSANLQMLASTVTSRNSFYETSDFMLASDELAQEAGGNAGSMFPGALVMPDAHHVNPAKMILGLANLARSLGVTICERTEVVGIHPARNQTRIATNGGDILARDVLLTTGGYTGKLDRFLWERTLGLPSVVVASEEYSPADVSSSFPTGRALLINQFHSFSCRPSPDGRRILLAGPVAQTPGGIEDNILALRQYFSRLFPEVAHMHFAHCWTGMIAATRDAQGHSGAHNGVWYSVGASGLVSCADAGRRTAQNILHADNSAAAADASFPRWPLRDSEQLLWRGVEYSARLLDLLGRSRLR